MSTVVAVRTDAYFELGMGHLMRCLTLTKQLPNDEFLVIYFISEKSKNASYILLDHVTNVVVLPCFENENDDAKWVSDYLSKNGITTDYFLVDHYSLGLIWEKYVSSSTTELIVIDDLANRNHYCDYLIDSAMNRVESNYTALCNNGAELLLGEQYSILNPNIVSNRLSAYRRRQLTKRIDSILVSFGATDIQNYSQLVVNLLLEKGYIGEVHILTTSLNKNLNKLTEAWEGDNNVFIHSDINDVTGLILKMDLAIGALGGSAIERVALGLPSICIVTVDNQKFNGMALSKKNTIVLTNVINLESAINRCLLPSFMGEWKSIVENCSAFYDGLGVNRIAYEVFKVSQDVSLKRMNIEHCDFLFSLQCEEGNRLYSGNENTPSLMEHKEWFEESMLSENRRMWVISYKGYDVGYIRLDDLIKEEEVSIIVSNKFRKLGLAKSSLEAIKTLTKYSNIVATVHPENFPSINLFSGSGFKKNSERSYIWKKQ